MLSRAKTRYIGAVVGRPMAQVMDAAVKSVSSVCYEKWCCEWRSADVRSRHTERSLSCLSARPWNKQAQSINGPQWPRRLLTLQQFVEVRRVRCRQSLVYKGDFVLDTLLHHTNQSLSIFFSIFSREPIFPTFKPDTRLCGTWGSSTQYACALSSCTLETCRSNVFCGSFFLVQIFVPTRWSKKA